MNKKDLPEVGKYYHFWDDGKTSPSRHYICRVESIKTLDEAKNIKVDVPRWDHVTSCSYFEKDSLYNVWENQVAGHDWLFAEDTDYLVEVSCPKYDKHNLWFVRTKNGGWFSMDVQSSWQGGELDIDGSIYESILEYAKEWGYNDEYSNQTY